MRGTTGGLLIGVVATAVGLVIANGGAAPTLARGDDLPNPVITPPVGIHAGTCAEPAPDAAFALGDLEVRPFLGAGEDLAEAGVVEADAEEVTAPDAEVGFLPPSVLAASAEVETTFADLFAAPHVVAVHRSDEDYGTLIACGELTGAAWEGEDDVVIGLRPRNDSNYYGYAVFESDTGDVRVFGEGTTGITVYLFQGLNTLRGDRWANSPTATPSS